MVDTFGALAASATETNARRYVGAWSMTPEPRVLAVVLDGTASC
jgi:hypothetical protein